MYENIENHEIIPEIKSLPQMLVPDYKERSDPIEFKYELPQKEKNILILFR